MKTTEECLARIEEHLAAMRSIMEENHALAQKHLAQVSNPPTPPRRVRPDRLMLTGGDNPNTQTTTPTPRGARPTPYSGGSPGGTARYERRGPCITRQTNRD